MKIQWGMMWQDTSDKPLVDKIEEGWSYFVKKFKMEPEAVAIPFNETVPDSFRVTVFVRKENMNGMFVFVRNDYEAKKQATQPE